MIIPKKFQFLKMLSKDKKMTEVPEVVIDFVKSLDIGSPVVVSDDYHAALEAKGLIVVESDGKAYRV